MYFDSVFILGALAQQSLGQVRLKDVPDWLRGKTPSHPRDVVKTVQKGKRHKSDINVSTN